MTKTSLDKTCLTSKQQETFHAIGLHTVEDLIEIYTAGLWKRPMNEVFKITADGKAHRFKVRTLINAIRPYLWKKPRVMR